MALGPAIVLPYVGGEFTGRGARQGTVDPHGHRLARMMFPNMWSGAAHDVVQHVIAHTGKELGGDFRKEPARIFNHLQGVNLDARDHGAPHGIQPDLYYRLANNGGALGEGRIAEIKTLRYGLLYKPRDTDASAAVNRRAHQVKLEYINRVKRFDSQYDTTGATAQGLAGPAQREYTRLGGVVPIVVGAFGEFNKELHELVDDMAETGAHRHYAMMLQASPEHAKGILVQFIRQRLAITAMRENAMELLHKMERVRGGGGYHASPPPPPPPMGPRVHWWSQQFERGQMRFGRNGHYYGHTRGRTN